jgi:hypothetical protein
MHMGLKLNRVADEVGAAVTLGTARDDHIPPDAAIPPLPAADDALGSGPDPPKPSPATPTPRAPRSRPDPRRIGRRLA